MIKSFDQFAGDESGFRYWLFRIACNEINTFYRKSVRHSKALDKIRQQSPADGVEQEDSDDEDNQNKIAFLNAAIGTLKPKHQDILTLRFYEGLTSEQIGKVLDLNPATVRSQLSRSLKYLKKQYRLDQQQNAELPL